MPTTSRHFSHNDKRRIASLERRIDRLIAALARYGIHQSECPRRAAFLTDATAAREGVICSCGLMAIIETRGEA